MVRKEEGMGVTGGGGEGGIFCILRVCSSDSLHLGHEEVLVGIYFVLY